MDAVFEAFDVEVDDEAEAAVGELEVAAKLCSVEGEDDFYDFIFNDDGFVDKDVYAERIIKSDAVINDGLPLLAHTSESRFREFMAEAGFVDAIDETGAEVAMHDHSTADEFSGELILVGGGFGEDHFGVWGRSVLPQRSREAEERRLFKSFASPTLCG